MRSTDEGWLELSSSPVKPTQLRKLFFSAITHPAAQFKWIEKVSLDGA
jgi:hypothetical protein